eukprot:scpid82799/ scgid5779/ Temptin
MPSTRLATVGITALVILAQAMVGLGFSSFRPRIPNVQTSTGASNIPAPIGMTRFSGVTITERRSCLSVGHVESCSGSPSGGGNLFGRAFRTAGDRFTTGVCQADSDGDGVTNGQELGDPNCVWTQGATPSRSTCLSHPGFTCSSPTDPYCTGEFLTECASFDVATPAPTTPAPTTTPATTTPATTTPATTTPATTTPATTSAATTPTPTIPEVTTGAPTSSPPPPPISSPPPTPDAFTSQMTTPPPPPITTPPPVTDIFTPQATVAPPNLGLCPDVGNPGLSSQQRLDAYFSCIRSFNADFSQTYRYAVANGAFLGRCPQ